MKDSIQSIRALSLQVSDLPRDMIGMGLGPSPLPAECFGPYDPREHILRAQDLDALRLSATSVEFFEPERLGSLDLINELALSFLERTFIRSRAVPAAPETLFPHHGEPVTLTTLAIATSHNHTQTQPRTSTLHPYAPGFKAS